MALDQFNEPSHELPSFMERYVGLTELLHVRSRFVGLGEQSKIEHIVAKCLALEILVDSFHQFMENAQVAAVGRHGLQFPT